MVDIILYNQLSTCSKRAMIRIRGRFGRDYDYRPRGNLLERLARQNGMTIEQVYNQLHLERRELLRPFIQDLDL
jgi:hypothetical protein